MTLFGKNDTFWKKLHLLKFRHFFETEQHFPNFPGYPKNLEYPLGMADLEAKNCPSVRGAKMVPQIGGIKAGLRQKWEQNSTQKNEGECTAFFFEIRQKSNFDIFFKNEEHSPFFGKNSSFLEKNSSFFWK